MRILFCDLQYSNRGSFDDDILAIKSALATDSAAFSVEYYKDNVRLNDFKKISALLSFIKKGRFDRVVFLSARLTLVFALSFLIKNLHCIYHFLPNARKKLHHQLLARLKNRVRFGVYGAGLLERLKSETGVQATAVPSRKLNLEVCTKLYAEKARKRGANILVPGVRQGVRDPIDLSKYIQALTEKNIVIEKVYLQGDVDIQTVNIPVEKVADYADAATYAELFRNATYVIMHFTSEYELRASGMILDAVSHGCITLTEEHPITTQYGFPRFPVCSLETVNDRPTSDAGIREALLKTSIIFENEFSAAWKKYLCL